MKLCLQLLTWIIVMVSGMQIYKVKNQLPTINMDPDFLLVMDQPIKKQLRFHLWTALTWLILEIAIIVMFVLTVSLPLDGIKYTLIS